MTDSQQDPSGSETALLVMAVLGGFPTLGRSDRTAWVHAQGITGQVFQNLLKRHPVPLEWLHREHDALEGVSRPGFRILDAGKAVFPSLLGWLTAFDSGIQGMIECNACDCEACLSLDHLRLRILVHAGPVLRLKGDLGLELSGQAPSFLHLMRKSDLPLTASILMTAEAAAAMDVGDQLACESVELALPGRPPHPALLYPLERTWEPAHGSAGFADRLIASLRKWGWDWRFHGSR